MTIYVFAGLSVLLSAFALFFLADTLYFRYFARRLSGIVAGYETRAAKNGLYYYPVVEYPDNGSRFRLKSAIGSNTAPFAIGQEVVILVMGDQHATARLQQQSRFLIAGVLAVMGAAFLAPLLIETDHAVAYWYIPSVLLLAAAMLRGARAFESRRTKPYDDTPGEDGVIGYRPDATYEQNPETVKPYTVSLRTRLFSLLLGLLLVGGAAWLYRHENAFIASAATIRGEVFAIKSHRDSDGNLLYAPRVRFRPDKGGTFAFTSRVSSSHSGYAVGDQVTVFYDPADPGHAQIDRGIWNHVLPMGIAGTGALITLVTLIGLMRRKRA